MTSILGIKHQSDTCRLWYHHRIEEESYDWNIYMLSKHREKEGKEREQTEKKHKFRPFFIRKIGYTRLDKVQFGSAYVDFPFILEALETINNIMWPTRQ